MSELQKPEVEVRARYEHFRSRPGKRKTYMTLGFRATENVVDVLYIADYDPDFIKTLPIEQFTGFVLNEDVRVPRFTLVGEDVISVQERDSFLDELDADN